MLTIIPTPIGNLEDITYRAKRMLEEVEYLLVEDSRVTGRLLQHFNIKKKMVQFHSHNEHGKLHSILADMKQDIHIGLVSDAGTPCISDPGFLLIRECVKEGIHVECLPGATAFVPALAISGLPSDKFYFEGFLPRKKGRKTKLEQLGELDCTIILYESPFRVRKTLEDIQAYFGDRSISVSREISKKFEETIRGSIEDVILHFQQKEPKGEFVICISKPS